MSDQPGRNVASIDRSRRPPPGPPPRIELPTIQRHRLDNGLTVLAIRHDDLPEVYARCVIPHGATDDPAERAGTALLTARGLTEGSVSRSAREIAEDLDYLGARFGLDVSHDATILSLGFLSRVHDPALELMSEIITRPSFEEDEVARLRDERLDQIASGLDEPRVVASLRLMEAIFNSHPYGMSDGGVERTVASIDAPTVRGFHARFYRPSDATLILVGDLPEIDRLIARLEVTFGAWSGDGARPGEVEAPHAPDGRRVWAIQWDGPQSEIRLGGLGLARRDPDYPAAAVANAVLGGLFSSRINMNLREDKGWTYGAYSRFDARKVSGPYYIGTAVDARVTIRAVEQLVSEIERMRAEPPDAEELELAKNALSFSLPRLFETVGQVSGRVAHQIVYDLPDDYWERYGEMVRAVNARDVQEVAERYLDPDRVAAVVVGPVEEFSDELDRLGPVERRDVKGRPI